jgi:hypothetical protein
VCHVVAIDPPEPLPGWIRRAWFCTGGFSTGEDVWRCLKRMENLFDLHRWSGYSPRTALGRLLVKLGFNKPEAAPVVPGAMPPDHLEYALYILAMCLYKPQPPGLPVLALEPERDPGEKVSRPMAYYLGDNCRIERIRGDHAGCVRDHLGDAAQWIAPLLRASETDTRISVVSSL